MRSSFREDGEPHATGSLINRRRNTFETGGDGEGVGRGKGEGSKNRVLQKTGKLVLLQVFFFFAII